MSKKVIKKSSVEVDQSIRIEELNRDTVIGVASRQWSIAFIVPRKIKRHFNEYFRRLGQPKKCAPTLFAAAIVAVFHESDWQPTRIIIDTEYDGWENFIATFISLYFPEAVVSIERIGRSSLAHEAAYTTHRGYRQPDGVLTRAILEKYIK